MMKAKEFVDIAKRFVKLDTVYMFGGLLQPLTNELIDRKEKQWPKNKKWDSIYRSHIGALATDCVCFIKSVLWGATENPKTMKYLSNGVPDLSADAFFDKCTEKSKDFNHIVPGEICWMSGHVGIYVGNGLSVECTPIHNFGVQYSACNCKKEGHWTRNWTMHGKCPYIDYSDNKTSAKYTVKIDFASEKEANDTAKGLKLLGFKATI